MQIFERPNLKLMKSEHFVKPRANPVQTFISPTDNPGPGASAAAASTMTETQMAWHWPMAGGPGG